MRQLTNIIERVYNRPLLITPAGHASLRMVIENKLMGNQPSADELSEMFGDAPQAYDLMEGVRVIPVNGPIGYRVSGIEQMSGICDINSISQLSRAALEDESVTNIVYDFNTPGGEVTNVLETAELIMEVGKVKNTIGYCDTMACSAGMWLYAACNETYHTKTANLMSVGVYSYILDESEALKREGVVTHAYVSGDLKGVGIPGRSITEAQHEHMQAEVDMLGEMFRGFIKFRFPNIPDEMMRGQSVMGLQVAAAGITTGIANSIEDIFFHD